MTMVRVALLVALCFGSTTAEAGEAAKVTRARAEVEQAQREVDRLESELANARARLLAARERLRRAASPTERNAPHPGGPAAPTSDMTKPG